MFCLRDVSEYYDLQEQVINLDDQVNNLSSLNLIMYCLFISIFVSFITSYISLYGKIINLELSYLYVRSVLEDNDLNTNIEKESIESEEDSVESDNSDHSDNNESDSGESSDESIDDQDKLNKTKVLSELLKRNTNSDSSNDFENGVVSIEKNLQNPEPGILDNVRSLLGNLV